MVSPSCPSVASAIAGILLLLFRDPAFASGVRKPASPGYRGRDACPARCSVAGSNPSNWSVFHSLYQIQSCPQAVFYEFSIYDGVDDPHTLHRIHACASYGPDWTNLPNSATDHVDAHVLNDTAYEIGWQSESASRLAVTDVRTLLRQTRQYLENGYAATHGIVLLFARSGKASVGLYIGKGLQKEGTGSFALSFLHDNIPFLNISGGDLSMQLCPSGNGADYIFGLMATSNATFGPVQTALKSWSNGQCYAFGNGIVKTVAGPAFYTTPPLLPHNVTDPNTDNGTFTTGPSFRRHLLPRSECRMIQVDPGDGCTSLAAKCGISGDAFTRYNPAPNFCATLQPHQRVCCSVGALPDSIPIPNADGSCVTYTVQANDNCAGIAAANSLTVDQLIDFNKNTWAWNGCSPIWVGTIVCLSSGTPPVPAGVANAVCGPQVPGSTRPATTTNISTLNPCPLNACCDAWGQCGSTAEFCTETGTGATGIAGCISNCGTSVVRSAAPAVFRRVAYFDRPGLGRPCLSQEAGQIDVSQYTHFHFPFGTLSPDYEVQLGGIRTTYEFHDFKQFRGPKRILSFGGWAFSTHPRTYTIFRHGVTTANRTTMATNIAKFIIAHTLDGVDIDWQYPGVSYACFALLPHGWTMSDDRAQWYTGPGHSRHPTRWPERRQQLLSLPHHPQGDASRHVHLDHSARVVLVSEGLPHCADKQGCRLHHPQDGRFAWPGTRRLCLSGCTTEAQ